ncbi:MAG: hypothetical protein Q8R36_04365 [bacterium]|nr:hypothetical protein [bacterium]
MLIENGDNTYLAGPADILCILKLPTGTFHVAFFEEKPMPGPIRPINELDGIRLKSKMHHTVGGKTLAEAQAHLRELRAKIKLPDQNVVDDAAIEVEDPVNVLLLLNWTRGNKTLKEVLLK